MNTSKKIKMTPQRAAIMEFLDGNKSHPSAEDIFTYVRKIYPMISFATVYNTLDALKKADMVWELSIDDERKRYDPNTLLHHHLICTKCRKVVDIEAKIDTSMNDNSMHGFDITGHHVEFYGICPDCAVQN